MLYMHLFILYFKHLIADDSIVQRHSNTVDRKVISFLRSVVLVSPAPWVKLLDNCNHLLLVNTEKVITIIPQGK